MFRYVFLCLLQRNDSCTVDVFYDSAHCEAIIVEEGPILTLEPIKTTQPYSYISNDFLRPIILGLIPICIQLPSILFTVL